MLRNLSISAKSQIIREINNFYNPGTLPDCYKSIRIVPILKPGRDPSEIKSYRPIACLSTITKSANSAVLKRVQEHLEAKKILPALSFGFRRGKSTEDCLEYVTNTVTKAKRSNEVSIAIFFDFTNAFSLVNVDILLATMSQMGFATDIINWIGNFLRNRKLVTLTEQGEVTSVISSGLPQGDVLSPTLFNVYTKILHDDMNSEEVVMVQFADDFSLIVNGQNWEQAKNRAQEVVDRFARSSERLQLKLNGSKTKAILFSTGNRDLGLTLQGNQIETVRHHKYLGINIDRRLSFGTHVRELTQKVRDRQNMLKIISSIRKGATPRVMVQFHKALYGGYLSYGSSIYGKTTKTYQDRLEITQRQCQRIATGCSKTTPINTLGALANEEPLHIKRYHWTKKRISVHFAKRDQIFEQLTQINLTELKEKRFYTFLENVYIENADELSNIYEYVHRPSAFSVQVRSQLAGIPIKKKNMHPDTMRQITLNEINTEYLLWRKVYTDASKTESGCGIGIYEEETNLQVNMRIENETSIMGAELLAIKVALEELLNYEQQNTVILTDSQAACTLIQIHQDSLQWDALTEEICRNLEKTKSIIQWIPGHVGLHGNEKADQLAKLGVISNAVLVNRLMLCDATRNYKRQNHETTDTWYRKLALESAKGLKFFHLFNHFPRKPWYWDSTLDGDEIRTLNRIISGHDYSEFWLAKMNLSNFGSCELCCENNTTEHVLLKCVKYTHIRNHFYWDAQNIQVLLKNGEELNIEEMKNILKFLHMARLKP